MSKRFPPQMNTRTEGRCVIATNHHLTRTSNVGIVCGLFMFLTSCASLPEDQAAEANYPNAWARPQIPETKNCVSLTGSYRYIGEPANDDQNLTKPRFDALVFRRWPNRGQVDVVNVNHKLSQEILEAHLIGQGLSPETQVSYSHPAKCIDGWVTISSTESGYSDGTYVSGESLIRIAKAQDGSLSIQANYHTKSKYVPSLFEKERKGSAWYRFLPIQ